MAVKLNASVGDLNGDLLRRTAGMLNDNAAYTVMFWFYFPTDTDRINVLWYFTNSGYPSEYLALSGDGVTLQLTSLRDGSTGYTAFGSALTPGTWYHVALVRTGVADALKVYLNGTLNITGETINMSSRPAVSKIDFGGGNPDGSSPFNGTFAFGRAWQRALSGAEVAAEKDAMQAVSTSSIYGDWPLIGGSGQFQSDISGQGHDWSVRGTIDTNQPGPPLPQTLSIAALTGLSVFYSPTLIRPGADLIIVALLDASSPPLAPALGRHYIGIDVGVDAKEAAYEHVGIKATEVEITYKPKQTYTGLLWETKSEDPIKIKAGETREMAVSPETSEGFKITPFTVEDYLGSSTYTALDGSLVDRTAEVIATITQEGQQLRLKWINTTTDQVTITAEIYGSGFFSKDSQTLLILDETLLQQNGGFHRPLRISLSLVSDELEAQALAEHLLSIVRNQVDGIFSVSYEFGDSPHDQARQQRLAALTVGDVVELTELQTGIVALPCMILHEQFDYSPAAGLKLTHKLLPIELALS